MVNLDSFRDSFPTIEPINNLSGAHSLDDPAREKFINFPLEGLLHPLEKREKDLAIKQKVKEIFRVKYGFEDSKAFDRVWRRIGAKVWTPSEKLTLAKMSEIDEAFKTRLVYHGKGMPSAVKDNSGTPIERLVQTLVHGKPFPKELLDLRTMRAFLIKQDPALLNEFKGALQRELDHLAAQVPTNPSEELAWRTFLGNLLGFIPFAYPSAGETLRIPVLENGVCNLVEYELEVIPLEFNKLSTPMPAIAMTPKDRPDAPPVLVFMGTTYPAGDGFAASLQSDFTPDYSVGELAYEINHRKIAAWMKDKKNVHVIGISLGGAMAFHAVRHQKEISRVDVYNPPGLYAECWEQQRNTHSNINIYCQPKDLVSELGTWPTKGNVASYEVLQHCGHAENPLSSHVMANSGTEEISIIKHDPKKQNESLLRKILTVLHRVLGPFLIFIPVELGILIHHYLNLIIKFAHRTTNELVKLLRNLLEACLER